MGPAPHLPDPPLGPLPIPRVYVPDEPRWEYHRLVRNVRTEDPPTEAELDALGKQGWELVGLFSDLPFLYLYLKRPV